MTPVWLSVDPALGGGFCVLAAQPTHDRLYVLDCDIRYGLTETEQMIEGITTMARRYGPQVVIIEMDSQQKGLGNDRRLHAISVVLGFEIRPHLSRMTKHLDQVYGIASMNQSFIRNEISIPWADIESQRRMTPLVEQLRLWRPPEVVNGRKVGLTKNVRQDAAMALWMLWRPWMQDREQAAPPPPVPQHRPSWMRDQAYRRPAHLRSA